MIRDAVFGDDGKKRYLLVREWGVSGSERRTLNLIGLNPSIAGYVKDDPTIRKGVGFATRWGCNRLEMTNLIPNVSTDPWGLPPWSGFDRENLLYLQRALTNADIVVAAWGSVPGALAAAVAFPEYIHWLKGQSNREIFCIARTANGSPRHPSRAPYTSSPVIYWESR